jgi:hypothetical protein
VSKYAPIAQEADFEAIRALLQAEVERADGRLSEDPDDRFSLRRDEAERLWSVSAERPFLYRAGAWGQARGLLLVPIKSSLRKLMRWYVEPLALDQRRFNAALLKLVDALSERADAGLGRLEQRLGELDPRVEAQGRRESESGSMLRTHPDPGRRPGAQSLPGARGSDHRRRRGSY